ncbi:MAG: beta-eliminating lyase-related protein [Pseudomonadota bacterium]|nr:beta-eliminating lyase-related protein [Pseudomonadota bacterium]
MTLDFQIKKGFGSDNHCGAHPKIAQAIIDCNKGHVPSYGTDELCERAIEVFKKNFGTRTQVYFVFNGSAANTLSLKALTQSFNSVFCSDVSHIYNDECGAPEMIGHCKLIPLASQNGKINLKTITEQYVRLGDQHSTQPKVISLTQPTEVGTVYSLKEIKEICDFAHSKNMYVHVDGARLPNAAVTLNCTFKELTTDLGVDVISFGGTKNGLVFGEAVLFLMPQLAQNFQYIRKQCLQLPSKSRFVAAQFLALFEKELWRDNATYVTKLAQSLYQEVKDIKSIEVTEPVQSNAVFIKMPKEYVKILRDKYFFYVWDEKTFECRIMMSFDNTIEEIKDFARLIRELEL